MPADTEAPSTQEGGGISGFLHRKLGDLDEVFAYQTPKIAKIKDRKLGLLRMALMVFIFFYIVVFQIFYKGEHLKKSPANGVFRLQLQQPTMNGCNPFDPDCHQNFTAIGKLPYCEQSDLDWNTTKLPCMYKDGVELTQHVESGIMIPTRVESLLREEGCQPSDDNNWKCEGSLYHIVGPDGTPKGPGDQPYIYNNFIADVEQFTLLVDHSFKTEHGGIFAEDYALNGFWNKCPPGATRYSQCEEQEVLCVHGSCPSGSKKPAKSKLLLASLNSKENVASTKKSGAASRHSARQALKTDSLSAIDSAAAETLQEARGMQLAQEGMPIAIKKGDVFSLEKLLEISHQSLDDLEDLDRTVRERGMVLVIHIRYTNILPWMGVRVWPWTSATNFGKLSSWYGPRPWYTYWIAVRPAYDYSIRKDKPYAEDNKWTEIIEYQGVRIVVEQAGEIAVWDVTKFLLVMTTSLGLLAAANLATDVLALYVFARKNEYKQEKFAESKDFNDHP